MIPQCLTCRRLKGPQSCEAYPTGIPESIWQNEVDHSKPYEDDNGLQYVQR